MRLVWTRVKPHDVHDTATARVTSRVCAYEAHDVCGRQIVHMGPLGGRTNLETVETVATGMHHTHSMVPTALAQVLKRMPWTVESAARCRSFNGGFPRKLSYIWYISRARIRPCSGGTTWKGARHHSIRELLSRRVVPKNVAATGRTRAPEARTRGCSREAVCIGRTDRKSDGSSAWNESYRCCRPRRAARASPVQG